MAATKRRMCMYSVQVSTNRTSAAADSESAPLLFIWVRFFVKLRKAGLAQRG